MDGAQRYRVIGNIIKHLDLNRERGTSRSRTRFGDFKLSNLELDLESIAPGFRSGEKKEEKYKKA